MTRPKIGPFLSHNPCLPFHITHLTSLVQKASRNIFFPSNPQPYHFTLHTCFPISFSPASVLRCFLPACGCLFMPTHSRLSSIRDRHLSYHTTQIAAIQEVPFVGCFCSISNVSSTLFMVMGSYFENLVVGILQYVFCMIN